MDSSKAECDEKFDPKTDPPTCAVPCPATENNNQGGYYYAVNPEPEQSNRLVVAVAGVDKSHNVASGDPVCSQSKLSATKLESDAGVGARAIILFCPYGFDLGPAIAIDDNDPGTDYAALPDGDIPKQMSAHMRSLTYLVMHEMAHVVYIGNILMQCSNIELKSDCQRTTWRLCQAFWRISGPGVVFLGQKNDGRSADANAGWKNVDSQVAFCLGMHFLPFSPFNLEDF